MCLCLELTHRPVPGILTCTLVAALVKVFAFPTMKTQIALNLFATCYILAHIYSRGDNSLLSSTRQTSTCHIADAVGVIEITILKLTSSSTLTLVPQISGIALALILMTFLRVYVLTCGFNYAVRQ